MTKINLITPPDKLYTEVLTMTVICPSKDLLNQLQSDFLNLYEDSINIYLYDDKEQYTKEDLNWLLDVVNFSNIVILDLDNSPDYIKRLSSYFIAKPNVFWLTNYEYPVYNHISSNRIYNLGFLNKYGGSSEKKQSKE